MPSQLMNEADVILEGGSPIRVSRRVIQKIRQRGVVIPLERRQKADMEFLAAIQCGEKMISEQQAAMNAAES